MLGSEVVGSQEVDRRKEIVFAVVDCCVSILHQKAVVVRVLKKKLKEKTYTVHFQFEREKIFGEK